MKNNYTKYFDSNFNFNNIVKTDRINDVMCNDDIMLEPRLQEYLKKKKFYKENNIEPNISIETEFQITSFDKKILRTFLLGDRNIYENNYKKFNNKSTNQKINKFPSSYFKEDKRVPKIKKQKNELPENMGMFVPDSHGKYYENKPHSKTNNILDNRDFEKIKWNYSNDYNFPKNNQNNKIQNNQNNYNNYNNDQDPRNKYIISKLNKKHPHGINNTKNNISSEYLDLNDMENMKDYNLIDENESIKNENRYGEESTPIYSSMSTMDTDFKIVTPNMAYKSKRDLNVADYNMTTFGDLYIRDTDLESSMTRGISSKTMKSYGYKNPDDHYFDFINEDEYLKSTEISPFERGGESSRLSNHEIARPNRLNKKKIYN